METKTLDQHLRERGYKKLRDEVDVALQPILKLVQGEHVNVQFDRGEAQKVWCYPFIAGILQAVVTLHKERREQQEVDEFLQKVGDFQSELNELRGMIPTEQ
jgi:uncharacterized protein YgfB (UPF0149 family)